MNRDLTQLKGALDLLNSISEKTKKTEMRTIAKSVYAVVKEERRIIILEEHVIPNCLKNVLESTHAMSGTMKSEHKTTVRTWLVYAKENLIEYINFVKKEGY